jgi:hypothetical protein
VKENGWLHLKIGDALWVDGRGGEGAWAAPGAVLLEQLRACAHVRRSGRASSAAPEDDNPTQSPDGGLAGSPRVPPTPQAAGAAGGGAAALEPDAVTRVALLLKEAHIGGAPPEPPPAAATPAAGAGGSAAAPLAPGAHCMLFSAEWPGRAWTLYEPTQKNPRVGCGLKKARDADARAQHFSFLAVPGEPGVYTILNPTSPIFVGAKDDKLCLLSDFPFKWRVTRGPHGHLAFSPRDDDTRALSVRASVFDPHYHISLEARDPTKKAQLFIQGPAP